MVLSAAGQQEEHWCYKCERSRNGPADKRCTGESIDVNICCVCALGRFQGGKARPYYTDDEYKLYACRDCKERA